MPICNQKERFKWLKRILKKGDVAYWKTKNGVIHKVEISSANEEYAIVKAEDHFVGYNRKVKLENLFKKPPEEWFKQEAEIQKRKSPYATRIIDNEESKITTFHTEGGLSLLFISTLLNCNVQTK